MNYILIGAFWGVVLSGAYYFYFYPRRFDFFSLGFAASVFYFLPGLWGKLQYISPTMTEFDLSVSVEPLTYVVFIFVLLGIILGGIVYEKMPSMKITIVFPNNDNIYKYCTLLFVVMLFLSTKSFLIDYLLVTDKRIIINNIDIKFVLFQYSILFLIVSTSISDKNYLQLGIAIGCVLLILALNFRFVLVIAGMSIITAIFFNKKPMSFARRYYYYLLSLPFVLIFVMALKTFVVYVKYFGIVTGFMQYIADFDVQSFLLPGAEFFVTTNILNEVISQNFHIDNTYLLYVPIYMLPIPSSVFNIPSNIFNTLFQPQLFADIEWGMAYNPWAEAIAAGGFTLLLIYIMVYVFSLGISNWLIKSNNLGVKTIGTLCGTFWAFYFHRNSLLSEFAYIRYIVWIGLLLLICATVASFLFKCMVFLKR